MVDALSSNWLATFDRLTIAPSPGFELRLPRAVPDVVIRVVADRNRCGEKCYGGLARATGCLVPLPVSDITDRHRWARAPLQLA